MSGGGPLGFLVALAENHASVGVLGLLQQPEGAVLLRLGVGEDGVGLARFMGQRGQRSATL